MAQSIFLSSTYTDLVDFRERVRDAIRQYGAHDIAMEAFGAREQRPKDECLRLIREDADLFVGIYAHRYGFVPEGDEISLVESEYLEAYRERKPLFIYLVDENQPWIPSRVDSGENADRLTALKSQLRSRHMCGEFRNQDHLASLVIADVGRHVAMQNAERVSLVSDLGSIGPDLEDIGIESGVDPVEDDPAEWLRLRKGAYDDARGVFLVHRLEPSTRPNQQFEVYIYLVRHKSDNWADVARAEFFLGKYWANQVFVAKENNGFIGIRTAAYGTFLCLCRVTFRDGHQVEINRYIDFEAARYAH